MAAQYITTSGLEISFTKVQSSHISINFRFTGKAIISAEIQVFICYILPSSLSSSMQSSILSLFSSSRLKTLQVLRCLNQVSALIGFQQCSQLTIYLFERLYLHSRQPMPVHLATSCGSECLTLRQCSLGLLNLPPFPQTRQCQYWRVSYIPYILPLALTASSSGFWVDMCTSIAVGTCD